jgi:prolyl-tRNA synthetase
MRHNSLLIPTLRAAPADAELASHKLLVRAGYIRQLAAGVYSFLPLAWRSLQKVENIIRQEMNRAGAQELLLPLVHPSEIWEQSGRWFQYGAELLRFQDRKGGDFCLAPTHEEAVTALIRDNVRSYKQLPMNVYQIQFKFRDEVRPRAGLMRGREFIMKDAYSFDVDVDSAKASYQKMYDAYTAIFTRLGFDFRVVQADTGNIGGDMSHEFQALAATGEDSMLACGTCDWAANVEKAELRPVDAATEAASDALTKVHTPEVKSVDEVAAFLSLPASQIVKTLILAADGKPVAAMLRGDHELNDVKLNKLVGATELEMAGPELVSKVTGAPVGFAGPVGLPAEIPIYVDQAVAAMGDFVIGANEGDQHYLHASLGRDFQATEVADLRLATEADPCPQCGEAVKEYRGIELGHIFYLSTKYSKPMKAGFLDANGKEQPFEMGCYGIGVSRILPGLVEQAHDDYGIVWPIPVAPFEVTILPLQTDVPELLEYSLKIYQELLDLGVDVLLDDRKERAGVKFKDAELIGIPFQIVVGKKGFAEQQVELKDRKSGEKTSVSTDEVVARVKTLIEEAHARYAVK